MATDEQHATYLAKVQKYDDGADPAIVKKIANKLGIALRGQDSSHVACSDISELERIRDGFAKKTLGLDTAHSDEEIMQKIKEVCEQMKVDGARKHRVPFYYLLAKNTDNLSKI